MCYKSSRITCGVIKVEVKEEISRLFIEVSVQCDTVQICTATPYATCCESFLKDLPLWTIRTTQLRHQVLLAYIQVDVPPAADLEERAVGGTQDVGRETARLHGIFRAADHLVQPGRAVAAGHVDGMIRQRGAHELQAFGQPRQIGHHLVGRRVVEASASGDFRGDEFFQGKCVESIMCTSVLLYLA